MIGREPSQSLIPAEHFRGWKEDQPVALCAAAVFFPAHGERQPPGTARQLPLAGAVRPGDAPQTFRLETVKGVQFIGHAVNHNQFDFGLGIRGEQIAVGDHQVGDLSGLDRAQPLCRVNKLCGNRRQRRKRHVLIQPALYGSAQIRPELVSGVVETIGAEGELHARFIEKCGVRRGELPVLELLQ